MKPDSTFSALTFVCTKTDDVTDDDRLAEERDELQDQLTTKKEEFASIKAHHQALKKDIETLRNERNESLTYNARRALEMCGEPASEADDGESGGGAGPPPETSAIIQQKLRSTQKQREETYNWGCELKQEIEGIRASRKINKQRLVSARLFSTKARNDNVKDHLQRTFADMAKE